MSFLTTNAEEANKGGFGVPDSGTYECFIKGVEPNYTSAAKGTPGTELVLVIRDDVDQPFQGSKAWDRLYDVDAAKWRYNQLTTAAGAEDGTHFETKQAIADFLKGKPVKVTLAKTQYQANDGTMKDQAEVKRYELSDVGGQMKPEDTEPTGSNPQPIEINDDDLPF